MYNISFCAEHSSSNSSSITGFIYSLYRRSAAQSWSESDFLIKRVSPPLSHWSAELSVTAVPSLYWLVSVDSNKNKHSQLNIDDIINPHQRFSVSSHHGVWKLWMSCLLEESDVFIPQLA